MAVDQQSDVVYALDGDNGKYQLYKFDLDGNPMSFEGAASNIDDNALSLGEPSSQVAVDPNTHVIYVIGLSSLHAYQASGEPAEFTAGPGAGTNEIGGFSFGSGVAVDADGAVYVSDELTNMITVYEASGGEITQFETVDTEPSYLSVSSGGVLYVSRLPGQTKVGLRRYVPSAFPVTPASTYVADPTPFETTGAYQSAVDPASGDVYVGHSQVLGPMGVSRYSENGVLLSVFGATSQEEQFLGVHDSGIGVDAASGRVFVARNNFSAEFGPIQVRIFDPRVIFEGRPTVVSASVSDVTADSARLHARINPNTRDTTYRFEYGLEDCAVSACVNVAGAGIGAGKDPVAVSRAIAGLQPGTSYHYRVVAKNSFGETQGPDHTFTTQLSGSGMVLADGRVWEMVSPPNKHGGEVLGGKAALVKAAADGGGITYPTRGSIVASPDGSRAPDMSTVLSRRGSGGWASEDITTPNRQLTPLAGAGEYPFFTSDLSRALLAPFGDVPLSERASERTLYIRDNGAPPSYLPLVTGKDGFANVPPGTEFGGSTNGDGLQYLAADESLSDVVLSSPVPLVDGAPANAMYRWRAGELELVSRLPAGEGGKAIASEVVGSDEGSTENAISADGSRIFWAPFDRSALYLRDMEAGETTRLDMAPPGAEGAANPVFQAASADGTVVFFTDSQQLTADASPSGRDLYRCEIPAGAASSGCAALTDISAPLPGSGESADLPGLVSGVTEDGTTLFFVATGVLDLSPNGEGGSAVSGEPNLYLWQEGEGTRFVATLSPADKPAWGAPSGTEGSFSANLATGISPDGRYLAFMSSRSLTGEDNLDPVSGEPVERVFRYDAATDRLDCISCDPTGAAPDGESASSNTRRLVDPRFQWDERLIAAAVPQGTVAKPASYGGDLTWRPRAVLDSGRMFFNSFDALVPADSNGQWDVYEYEPTGVGDCSVSSGDADTARSAVGCVSLLSSGTGSSEAGFLDASASGDDVFFLTPARLSVTDGDQQLDIYDARVGGVAATLEPSSECQGEACQPAALAPDDATPGTATFQGPGDPKPAAHKRCPKGKRLVRRHGKDRCVPRKQHKKHHRRSGTDRRAAR